MSLIQRAKADIERITSNQNEFGVEMVLTAPTSETITVTGLHTKINLGVDTDGQMVNSKKAHISVSEKFLTDAGYPVRDGNGEVNLRSHKVSVNDSTGSAKEYVITEWFPNETVGLITCLLGDYESD